MALEVILERENFYGFTAITNEMFSLPQMVRCFNKCKILIRFVAYNTVEPF